MTGEEGHRDPEWGMRLLDEAEEDIERSLSLAGDVDEIKADSLQAVETAENIAPIAKRPRKAWDMGQREVELGSLEKAKHSSGKLNFERMKLLNGGKKPRKRLEKVRLYSLPLNINKITFRRYCPMLERNSILRSQRKRMSLQW